MLLRAFIVYTFLLIVVGASSAQNDPQKIYFKKDKDLIYFFQVKEKKDTIIKDKTDEFFLLIPDSLKDHVKIDLDNAKFQLGPGDSIVKLIYLPGLRYEAAFTRPITPPGSPLEKYRLNVQINGPSSVVRKMIRIQFMDRRNNKVVLENVFSVP